MDTQDSCWPRGATRRPTGSCQREAAPERPIRSVPAKTPPASCGWRSARRLAVDAPARVSEDPRQGLGLQGRRPLGAHAGCSDVRAPRGARASGLVLARGTVRPLLPGHAWGAPPALVPRGAESPVSHIPPAPQAAPPPRPRPLHFVSTTGLGAFHAAWSPSVGPVRGAVGRACN